MPPAVDAREAYVWCSLQTPVAGWHPDLVGGNAPLDQVSPRLGDKGLSLGVFNGRNIWRADLDALLDTRTPLKAQLGGRLWLAPSCSLLHSPVDLDQEDRLDDELKSWLSFAKQKLDELAVLGGALDGNDSGQPALPAQRRAVAARGQSRRIHEPAVGERMAASGQVSRARLSPVRRAHRQTAGGAETARLPHHHHRLVSADQGDPRRPP